jgi:hypothetical protein
MLAGYESHATRDIDMLIDVMAGASNIPAAYCTDRRDRHRRLDDMALLASLLTDHRGALEQLHGSNRKRLRSAAEALSDPNDSAWAKLNAENRKSGQLTLHILTA